MVCPRCNRLNDRSPFVLGIKFLAVVLFVCSVSFVVQITGNTVSIPKVEEVRLERNATQAIASPPDVRF